VVLEVDEARASEVRSELGPDSLVVTGDATDPVTVAALAGAINETYGRLDVLVNNVGHFMTRPTPFELLTDEQLDDSYRMNLKHVFIVTRAMIPLLRGAGTGSSIVNVSSIEGFRGIPQFAAYGAFKAAITGFTQSLALELGPQGIRVNVVAPETTDTAQVPLDRMIHESQRHNIPRWIPLGRFGTPSDVAGCVLFLASPLASWVSGTVIHADGGALAAAGWYRDDQDAWTNMPVIKGSSSRPAES
jgi:3-oxoacyl-[acyl-carrier protein] reductase